MTGYTLIRAKRRTMSLQLDRDGHAVVRAPYGVKKEFIDRFVAEHAAAAVWALPLLGHRAVPAVWPQHAKRLLQPRRKMR